MVPFQKVPAGPPFTCSPFPIGLKIRFGVLSGSCAFWLWSTRTFHPCGDWAATETATASVAAVSRRRRTIRGHLIYAGSVL
jgi:hypothetical protein